MRTSLLLCLVLSSCAVALQQESRRPYLELRRELELAEDPVTADFAAWARKSRDPSLMRCVRQIAAFDATVADVAERGFRQGFRPIDLSRAEDEDRLRAEVLDARPLPAGCAPICEVDKGVPDVDWRFAELANARCEAAYGEASDAHHDGLGLYMIHAADQHLLYLEDEDPQFVYRARVVLELEEKLAMLEPVGPRTTAARAAFQAAHADVLGAEGMKSALAFWPEARSDATLADQLAAWRLSREVGGTRAKTERVRVDNAVAETVRRHGEAVGIDALVVPAEILLEAEMPLIPHDTLRAWQKQRRGLAIAP
ncbi:MAG: hypothetical protein EP330_28920 [Deltaproteobacteria bacterium]|nr:MAG: hypothetical protein EP330_28920 [Deltaproteobacteria bacterium]